MKKILELGILAIGVLVITLGLVSAFTFGMSYSSDIPLNVYPGETKDIQVRLAVSPSDGPMRLKVDLADASGIAKITDSSNIYSVSPGVANDGIVNIRVRVPDDAAIGKRYTFSLTASDANAATGAQMVNLAQISSTSFDAVVVEKPAVIPETPEPAEGISPIWWVLGIIAVIAIIAIIWFVVKSKKD